MHYNSVQDAEEGGKVMVAKAKAKTPAHRQGVLFYEVFICPIVTNVKTETSRYLLITNTTFLSPLLSLLILVVVIMRQPINGASAGSGFEDSAKGGSTQ